MIIDDKNQFWKGSTFFVLFSFDLTHIVQSILNHRKNRFLSDHSPLIVLPCLQLTHTFPQTWMMQLWFLRILVQLVIFLRLWYWCCCWCFRCCCFWCWYSRFWTCLVRMKEWNKVKLQMKTKTKSSLKSSDWNWGKKLWHEEKFQLKENSPSEIEQSFFAKLGAKMGQIGITWKTIKQT